MMMMMMMMMEHPDTDRSVRTQFEAVPDPYVGLKQEHNA